MPEQGQIEAAIVEAGLWENGKTAAVETSVSNQGQLPREFGRPALDTDERERTCKRLQPRPEVREWPQKLLELPLHPGDRRRVQTSTSHLDEPSSSPGVTRHGQIDGPAPSGFESGPINVEPT